MEYKNVEYDAEVRLQIISMIIISFIIKYDDIMIIISLRIFNLGGIAIFIEITMVHIRELDGLVDGDLFVSIMFRVCSFSYIKLVNRNIHDDERPCLIIIISLPYCPSFEFDRFLITSSPM